MVAKHRQQMKLRNSHLKRNIFNLYMRRFFFGLVYLHEILKLMFETLVPRQIYLLIFQAKHMFGCSKESSQ